MRIKTLFILVSILLLCFFSAGSIYGSDEWMLHIRVKALDAQNRLIIGQKTDAVDGIEGRYDVPALLSGDIGAYINLEGNHYWKDIRQTCDAYCRKTWNISIESAIQGEVVTLSWSSPDVAATTHIILIDKETGMVTDMISGQYEYAYENSGKREFTVVTESW